MALSVVVSLFLFPVAVLTSDIPISQEQSEGAWPPDADQRWILHSFSEEGVELLQTLSDETGWINLGGSSNPDLWFDEDPCSFLEFPNSPYRSYLLVRYLDEWGEILEGTIPAGEAPEGEEAREYLEFDLASLDGAEILDAALGLRRFFREQGNADPYDPGSGAGDVELYRKEGEALLAFWGSEGAESGGGGYAEGMEESGSMGPPDRQTRGLSGTYIINNAGGGDYTSFTGAVDTLVASGVDGPVTFIVYDDGGIYSEQVGGASGIPAITGADDVNTITFRAATAQDVVLDGGAHGIYIHGGDYLRFEGFSITSCTQDGVFIYEASDHNTLKNLSISGVGTSGSYSGIRIEVDCDYTTVDGCTIFGDYYGISLYSSHTDGCEYTVLRNNRILDALQDGIRMDASTTGYYHRYSEIYNNMIAGPMAGYGMYLSHVGNDELYFNSVRNDLGGGLYFNITSGSRRPEGIKNNVVKVTGDRELYAIYMQTYDALPNADAIDYNDWYAPLARVGYIQGLVCQNLVEWQDATSRDYNSISHEPYFASGTDLHIQTFSPCQRRGIYLDLFPTDMDGQGREYPPDMGADENLTPLAYMDGTYAIYDGGGFSSFGEAVEEVFVRGVEGPVVFEVYTDTYAEQVGGVNGIAAIPGAGATNTITFREASGHEVIIEGDTHCIDLLLNECLNSEMNYTPTNRLS